MQTSKFMPLQVEQLPLCGQHLIEASAGTGKTFNITRIYIRLLLEKKLTVQEILVMTFTRDATEELRGRIREDIQKTLTQWGGFSNEDPFYAEIQARFSSDEVKSILNNALLHMDEAAIFTIHGFCNRVLTEQSFASGLEFSMKMEANTQEIELEAIRDLYRRLSNVSPSDYEMLSSHWLTPELFYQAFRSVLSDDGLLTSIDTEQLATEIEEKKSICLREIISNQSAIFEAVVDSHIDKENRHKEWAQLIEWLKDAPLVGMPKLAKDFLNGGRYRKAENKALICQTLDFKAVFEHMLEQIKKGKVFQLAHHLIEQVRLSIIEEKASHQVMNFDDLITKLKTCLLEEKNGKLLAQAIRKQYPVALVDEFQDTDPQQFSILREVYGCASKNDKYAIFMIGDPKQAIYGFRGGDIFAYLQARNYADHTWVMDTNWRSTPGMITSYNRLFYGKSLNEKVDDSVFGYGIDYLPVKASPVDHQEIKNDDYSQAMQFVYFPFNEDFKPARGKKEINSASFRQVIANWCAQEINRLLTKDIVIGEQSVKEDDIAILVRSGSEAKEISTALMALGYNSVYLSNKENLFHSSQANEFCTAIEGILEYEDNSKMLAALSTRYFGGTSELLNQLQHDELVWEKNIVLFKELHDLWQMQGFMSMALKLVYELYQPEANDHERAMTNTIHLVELLQQAGIKHKQPRQLIHYLRSQIQLNSLQQEAELRLESDEKLIKIVTQHGCKGLEYPVVFIPFASKYSDPTKLGAKTLDIHYYHDENGQSIRQIGNAPQGVGISREEGLAESVRLLYVSVTRAIQRCYICATTFDDGHLSPLGKTLNINEIEQLESEIIKLSDELPLAIGFRKVEEVIFDCVKSQDDGVNHEEINVTEFSGNIETTWQLNSFSSLIRNAKYQSAISNSARCEGIEERRNPKESINNLKFAIKKGADTGNLLHDVLERLDFSSPNFAKASSLPLLRYSYFPDQFKQEDFYSWLEEIIEAPLGSDRGTEQFSLSQLTQTDTLKEVEFYFPIENVDMSALVKVLAQHRGVESKTLCRQLPSKNKLQGMMRGFIDLVAHWQDCYFVIDYKSTWLGSDESDYQVEQMEQDVQKNFYDLQYLIYVLALHRFLKHKLVNYEPAVHLGGALYLYLRGMSKEHEQGVYHKHIDVDFIESLDGIFNGNKLAQNSGLGE